MLSTSIKQFKYYKQLADKSMAQVEANSLFHTFHHDDNSIAVVIQHLSGNMKSRWTNIFTEDGEKPWRNRDSEFEPFIASKAELMEIWEAGWMVLFQALDSVSAHDLSRIIYIRNEGMTLEDAILRQLCHYSYHCGQIVYKCKQLSEGNWESLSIPKNESADYNFKKFEEIKAQKHFLDSLLEEGS